MTGNGFIASAREAAARLNTAPPAGYREVEARYPFLASEYYLSLIDRSGGSPENDPIWRQCMPAAEELEDEDGLPDPLAESAQMPVPRLIRRYPDRAVLLVTGSCATRCRFCFRKRFWADGGELADISAAELAAASAYLHRTPAVSEVLISGGDPLMLPSNDLRSILDELSSIETIAVLRLGTRVPVTRPDLITPETVAMLAAYPGLWLMTHFNHPRELTPVSAALCGEFVQAGIPVLNQTVLLKGVNDDAATLARLFRQLIAIKVKPHYLFHVDPVRGVRHFATGIAKGLEVLAAFRSNLSSLAVPTFAIDLPEGGGKVSLQPEYRRNGKYPSAVDGHLIDYPG